MTGTLTDQVTNVSQIPKVASGTLTDEVSNSQGKVIADPSVSGNLVQFVIGLSLLAIVVFFLEDNYPKTGVLLAGLILLGYLALHPATFVSLTKAVEAAGTSLTKVGT